MAIVVELSVNVAADRQTIWTLLTDASTWPTWWRDCRAAAASDFRRLREGSQLEVVVQPRHGKTTFRPEVDLLTEGKTLSLTERSALLQTTVAWHLHATESGTRITVHGVLTGFATVLMRLTRQDDTVRFALHSNLRGLKKIAERMA